MCRGIYFFEAGEEIQALSDELLPTLAIQGVFHGEKAASYLKLTYKDFQLVIPTGVTNPESKMFLVLDDDPTIVAIKGGNDEVQSIVKWMNSK